MINDCIAPPTTSELRRRRHDPMNDFGDVED
jgi:hypothetical protein